MLSREGKQTDRGAVGAEFIGYNRRRREALLLQEFPHQPNCRPSVPAGLNQEIQDFALTVHGTPEIELPPSNYDDHLVQVPAFSRSWPPTLNPPRIGPTEFQDPSSNCLIRDVETTLGKQVLNVPIAQRETAIEPDGMLDDDRWKAVTTVGYLAHPETLKHRPCRSHAVNVTMPAGGTGRSGPEGISAIRPTREHPRLTSRTTFVVRTRRREFWDSSLMRTHAQSRAEIESPRARVPYAAGWELPPGTRLRAGARVKYWNRSPGAYGHRRSSAGTPRSYVEDQVPGTCIGGPRFRGFPLAELGECPRSNRRLDLYNRYPGFASPPCVVPMRQVSSRPDTAPGGAPFPGRLRDMSETAGRHDPDGAIQSVRRRQQRHGLAAGRLVARSGRGRATARRRDHSASARPRWRMDDRV